MLAQGYSYQKKLLSDEMNELKKKVLDIINRGWINDSRPNNKDGGIGNTFEDLLGIKENNKSVADYKNVEIKCQREFTGAYISLFSKSPTSPFRANKQLREKFGEERDEIHTGMKKLYASVFGNKNSKVYEKYLMKLEIDKRNSTLMLVINDLNNNILDQVAWTFDSLIKASSKIENLLLVFAKTQMSNNQRQFCFFNAEIFSDFDFNKFLICIEEGYIQFDIRIGVYNSGKNYGKTHDHGSAFRIKYENIKKLYNKLERLDGKK